MQTTYVRPRSAATLTKAERTKLIRDNFEHYRALAAQDHALLSEKIPREAFKDVLDRMGGLLLDEAKKLADEPGPVRDFLHSNTPPVSLARLLPEEFRAFCLLLNAAKIWISAEQAATDRYLLGGRARPELRAVADTCVITGQVLAEVGSELHHPVRDGRPPIPLSHEGASNPRKSTRHAAKIAQHRKAHG